MGSLVVVLLDDLKSAGLIQNITEKLSPKFRRLWDLEYNYKKISSLFSSNKTTSFTCLISLISLPPCTPTTLPFLWFCGGNIYKKNNKQHQETLLGACRSFGSTQSYARPQLLNQPQNQNLASYLLLSLLSSSM